MKNFILLNRLWKDSHEKQKPQRFGRYAVMLLMLLTLGVGQMWGAAKQRYIYCGISEHYDTYKDGSDWGFNFWGGTSGGVKSATYIQDDYHDGRNYKVYRVQVYDDNNKAQFKGNSGWWIPDGGKSVTLNGTTNNAVYFSASENGWYGQFQKSFQVTSTASLSATSTSIAIGGTSTLTPSLSSNSTYNDIKSTSYSVTTNPGSAGSVTSGGVFSATAAGSYTVTATVTYNAKDFTGITKTATATKTITVYATITFDKEGGAGGSDSQNAVKGNTTSNVSVPSKTGYNFGGYWTGDNGTGTMVINASGVWQKNISNYTDNSSTPKWTATADHTLYAKWLPQSLTITSYPTYLTTTDHMTLGIDYANIPSGYCYRVKVGAGYYNNSSNQDRDAISGSGSTSFTSYSYLPTGNNTVVVELWKNSPFEKQSVVSDGVTVTVEQAYLVNVRAYTDGVESTTGGTVSPASVNASSHLGQTITASDPNVGYDFTGWTANTANITFADATELSTTVYAAAGGDVYANYVRQVGSYSTTFYAGDHGSIVVDETDIAKNNNETLTIGENVSLAATPESAEYVFDHWGTTGSVSVANIYSATTTVTATDAGGTVTAYYRHVPVLGAVTATPSGQQNYAGSPIDFALSVTSTYLAHPVVVFLVNDGTTTYEVVGAPYGADGSSAAGTIGSDAAYTTVHKATFTASAAKSYTVSAKLYEGLLLANFDGKDFTGGPGWDETYYGHDLVTNPSKQAVNGSNNVRRFTKGANYWDVDLYRFAAKNAGISTFRYAHTRQYRTETGKTWLKLNDDKKDLVKDEVLSANTWQKVVYDNGAGTPVDFFYPLLAEGNTCVYFDDIILSNEETMTVKASQAATASFSINWNYTVTLNNNGATSAGTESVNVTYGSATGITNITVPTKTGYTFGGYYTEDAGAGTLQINASGVWQNAGYVSGGNWNSGSNQTLYAKWTENMTTVTISASPAGTGTFTVNSVAGSSASAGVTTTKSIVAVPHADYTWTSWTATNCSVSPTNNKSTTLSGDGSSSTGTLVGTFTQVPCTLWYHTSSATFAEKTGQIIMSYDLEEDAYYADVASTPSSPYYFRFYHNGATQYSADWDGSYPNVQTAVVNGSKISCTNVSVWGSKSSIKYVGNSGTSIRIWFDYQNKKAWITADKDNQYVLRGYKYDDSGAGGMPGWSATTTYFDGLASGNTGTITATLNAATKYKFKVYDRFSDTWYGHSTNNVEQEVTDGDLFATGTGTNNNFYFTSTIAGTYTFTVDKTSGLKVKVDFPVSYQLNYDIGTVKGTSGSISTDPTTASGSYVPSGNSVELTAPAAKTGYEWSGWFTNAAGTEGQIDDDEQAITVTMNADKTLYACYTENEYPVTVSAGSNGDVSPKGTVNVKQVNGTSLTATADEGYHFDHWAISGGGITPSSSTTSPQTFMATETDGTIQAIFAENTYTVNVNSGNPDFGSVSTTSVSGIGIATYSDEITATPETGATFTGWTLPSGVTAAAGYTSSSNPIKINATASGKAITANFSETKHTATITTEDDDYGTVSPTSASVGQITAVQITASKKTGYMFAGWVKTAGSGTVTYHVAAGAGSSVDATGSTQSITYITIDGNVTLQATWEEDRSAGWFLRGTWTDGWSKTGQKEFIKNVGETAGTVSYVRWTLAPEMFTDATMQMKMYDGSTYYGHSTDFDAAGNLCTKDNNNSNITFYSGVAYQNFKVSIPVAGEYIFRWDSSTKQLTITYPAGNFIRGTFDSWSWDHVLEPTGNANEYSCVISMTGDKAPHAWTGSDGFKVVLAGDHYGKNSTAVTRASNSASSLSREGNNINWTTDVRGDYTFTVNSSSKTVTVTYPDAYTVTYGYGAGGSSISASATSVGGTFSSGAYVAAGDDITFTQTAVDGNTFNGWYTTPDGNTEVPTMGKSDNVLNGLSGNATVYAQYIPTTYTNITLNATTGSTNGAYSVTFGGTTITVTTDPVKTGYEPEGFYESYADGKWTNKIAASNGTLQNGTTYTDATGHWTSTASPTLYTKWQPKTYGLTLDKNGTSAGYLTNGSVTTTYDSNTLTSLIAPTRTGYHIVDGYYKEPGLTNKIITVGGTLCVSTDYTDASGNWTNDGAVTLYAKWEPDEYTITFDPNSGTVDPTSADVTFDAAISNAPVPDRTGYTFTGYNTAGGASITTNGGVFKSSVAGFTDGSAHWIQPDDATITAQWSANEYTITLTQSTETGYGSAGTASVGATYDAALPTIASLPTAANGYAFMGYFTGHDGAGTKYYDADGTKMVASYTTADGVELFAYFKKAEITLAFDETVVLPEGTVGVTPTISPTPVGTTIICWTILHGDDTPLDPQPALTWSEGKLTFTASQYSGTYKVQAVLRTGSSCEGGDELDTETSSFMVAGTHNVTVNYKCGDDVIKASTIMENVEPLNWTDEFTAPDIFGYTFSRWDAADGVTIKNGDSDPVTTSTNATIQIKATYNGNLTAVYTQKSMIYFKNTLGWSNVYVNFYSSSYWNNPKGSGNQSVTHRNLAMTRYGETDIWYYDYGAASITPSLYVSFTSESQDNTQFFWKAGGVNVVYPANYQDDIHTNKSSETGFKAATPMFVPLATQEKVTLNQSSGGKADYYNDGYWTTYTHGTGYRLEIYNSDGSSMIKYADFESADDLMPMKAVLDLEGGQTYKFQLRRGGESSAGVYYGNSGTMTYTNHGQDTPWAMTNSSFTMAGITTNAAGDYTFNLSYSPNSTNQYRLRIAVDYPVKSGDYRLVYKDDVHTNIHPSAIVSKVNNGTDIVSFFVRHDQNPEVRIQQATVNPSTGAITWNEYPNSGTPTNQITGDIASAITSGGTEVYNFNLSMDGEGAMTVASAEIYEGNFYIRTDAANSKWDNYRTDPDHRMTYSEYSITHGGYTHYYTHWVDKDVTGRKNVKFVIANDYSPCISDTLTRETATGTWANIDKFIEEGGDLKRSANVRYMWDKRTNTISRAYVDGAQGDYSSNFLYMLNVEEGADKIKKDDGTALTDHKVTFKDNGNWMYEANIKAQPTAQIKLLSNWGTENTITQYFRGASDATETLLGGSGSTWYDIRVIYDFKTNRLIAGLIPSGTIDDQLAIHADVMFVREHHGDIAQLTFAEKDSKMGAITDIETAFGVIQFNKWTLNNKDKSTHSPLPNPQPSRYERDMFYVSFPFRVNLEEVFGFGTYGTHWIIEEYDGAARAANGFWADTQTFWHFITNRKGKFLEPNVGYILALDLDELGESSDVWANTDQVELYFPSYGSMPNITKSTVTYNIPEHICTIGPRFAGGDDRRIKDSHWNVMSVPTYVNTDDVTFANTDWITTADDEHLGPNFLYTWTMNDNSLTPTSGVGYTYKAMHAYIVQYCGNVTWTTSVSPTLAPRRNPEVPKDAEYRLELRQNDQMIDQTFVRLTDEENVTTGFDFNYDLSKEFNANKANIYTMVTTMMEDGPSITQTAGNCLPMSEQTTVVPVGVKIASNGDYTFAIPEGTNGVGVTLIDNETGVRTPLSALDYTINLPAGTYNERFLLEISPIRPISTDLENTEYRIQNTDVRKVLIDNILYIVKDGVMYDARGSRVQ